MKAGGCVRPSPGRRLASNRCKRSYLPHSRQVSSQNAAGVSLPSSPRRGNQWSFWRRSKTISEKASMRFTILNGLSPFIRVIVCVVSCPERDRLVDAFIAAVQVYNDVIDRRSGAIGSDSIYLLQQSNRALDTCESCLMALRRHEAQHGCRTLPKAVTPPLKS